MHRCVVDKGALATDLRFESIVPTWPPGVGHTRYVESDVFAWIVGAPRASVTGTIRVNGEMLAVRGIGYHDHNWGVGNMPRIVDHWYWGRVYADDVTLVYANVFSGKRYGFAASTPLMVAREDRIVLSAGEVTVDTGPEVHDETAGRAYPTWLCPRAGDEAELRLDVKRIIHAHDLLDDLPIVCSPLVSRSCVASSGTPATSGSCPTSTCGSTPPARCSSGPARRCTRWSRSADERASRHRGDGRRAPAASPQ